MYDLAAMQAGISRAVAGLRLVRIDGLADERRFVASGWLITSDLLVVPNFVVRPSGQGWGAAEFRFDCLGGADSGVAVAATPVFVSENIDTAAAGPALLRLERRFDDAFLPLDLEEIAVDERVFVPQHPGGDANPYLSIGNVRWISAHLLQHDADTTGGSSGAPILNWEWKVIGLQVGSARSIGEPESFRNQALSLAAILDSLKPTSLWSEIATTHRLVNLAAVRHAIRETRADVAIQSLPDPDLLAAAVRWRVDPTEFPPTIRSRLRAMVIDPSSEVWVLRPVDRERLLGSAGSMDALRQARGDRPVEHTGQSVIDRILQGPPFRLNDLEVAELPYWLQAVRWFADVVPGLPSAALINQELERRRSRSRLVEVSRSFRGRAAELARLQSWYQDPTGPLMITGIGGVGKSALIAHFVLSLTSPQPVLLWLDFDRVDLDPGEPVSVVRQFFEQLTVQVEHIGVPEIDEESWPSQLEEVAVALGAAASPPLVVLDGFEVAQHASWHERLWSLLETILQHAPRTRVLVSGRVGVRNLVLANRPAVAMVLGGLTDEDAKEWLTERGVDDPAVITQVLRITRRVPLALRLALRLVDEGVSMTDLPTELPDALVDGFLYRRVLDRVVDPLLKPIVQDALVLRWLTEAMLVPVLGDQIPEGWTPAETFSGLAHEYGLVGDTHETVDLAGAAAAGRTTLTLRPEVRQATLRLLELDDPARVRTVDERAVRWYSRGPTDELDRVARAELVYHLLRLQDLDTAKRVWRDSCAPLLLDAADELPAAAQAERDWLQEQTSGAGPSLEAWEHEAAERIRDFLGRGHVAPVRDVLAARPDRSVASPIVLYDAWMAWQDGDSHSALDILRVAGSTPQGSVANARSILEAALARSIGDFDLAERLLADLSIRASWGESDENGIGPEWSSIEMLAVVAAQIRLALDLSLEAVLAQRLASGGEAVRLMHRLLPASDVVLPPLLDRTTTSFESLGERILIPDTASELEWFAVRIDLARRRSLAEDGMLRPASERVAEPPALAPPAVDLDDSTGDIAGFLAGLAQRRWRLACTTPILTQAPLLLMSSRPLGQLEAAIVATLGAFASSERGQLNLYHRVAGSWDEILELAWKRSARVGEALASASDVVDTLRRSAHDPRPHRGSFSAAVRADRVLAESIERYEGPSSELVGVVLYLSSPDPLDELVRRIVGLTETNAK